MRRGKEGYYKNRHSCFLLQYHLVLVTKYRHPVIHGELEECLKDYVETYMKERGLSVIAMECMPDHIHILFEAPPQLELAKFVNALKSGSSRVLRKKFGEDLRPYYWKPYFWSLSYFVGTVSERTTEAVKTYIKTQKE